MFPTMTQCSAQSFHCCSFFPLSSVLKVSYGAPRKRRMSAIAYVHVLLVESVTQKQGFSWNLYSHIWSTDWFKRKACDKVTQVASQHNTGEIFARVFIHVWFLQPVFFTNPWRWALFDIRAYPGQVFGHASVYRTESMSSPIPTCYVKYRSLWALLSSFVQENQRTICWSLANWY